MLILLVVKKVSENDKFSNSAFKVFGVRALLEFRSSLLHQIRGSMERFVHQKSLADIF